MSRKVVSYDLRIPKLSEGEEELNYVRFSMIPPKLSKVAAVVKIQNTIFIKSTNGEMYTNIHQFMRGGCSYIYSPTTGAKATQALWKMGVISKAQYEYWKQRADEHEAKRENKQYCKHIRDGLKALGINPTKSLTNALEKYED